MKNLRIYHLSHTDLDGYGAQIVLANTNLKVVARDNTGYGQEILEKAVALIEKMAEPSKSMLLITDVNLTLEIATALEELRVEKGFKLLVLDHHITGAQVAEKYDWYILENDKCATKITFNYFKKYNTYLYMELFSDIVDAYDLWKEDNPLFKKGKLLNEVIFGSFKFPKEIKSTQFIFFNYVICQILNLYSRNKNVSHIEEKHLFNIKRAFVSKQGVDINDVEMTLTDRYNYLVYKQFTEIPFPIVEIGGLRFKLFYNVDGGVYQNVSSLFNSNKDGTFDGTISVNKQGLISLRSKGDIDVASIAKKYFNGGGHFNASGGNLPVEAKSFSEEDVLNILNALN